MLNISFIINKKQKLFNQKCISFELKLIGAPNICIQLVCCVSLITIVAGIHFKELLQRHPIDGIIFNIKVHALRQLHDIEHFRQTQQRGGGLFLGASLRNIVDAVVLQLFLQSGARQQVEHESVQRLLDVDVSSRLRDAVQRDSIAAER